MATAVNIIEFHGNQKMHFAIKRRNRRAYFTIYLLGRKFCSYCMWDIFLIKSNLKVNQIPWKKQSFLFFHQKTSKKKQCQLRTRSVVEKWLQNMKKCVRESITSYKLIQIFSFPHQMFQFTPLIIKKEIGIAYYSLE